MAKMKLKVKQEGKETIVLIDDEISDITREALAHDVAVKREVMKEIEHKLAASFGRWKGNQ